MAITAMMLMLMVMNTFKITKNQQSDIINDSELMIIMMIIQKLHINR